MGGFFLIKITVWTSWFLLCSVKTVSPKLDSLRRLDIPSRVDVTKINVSLDEYTTKMATYLKRLHNSQERDSIPFLVTYKGGKKSLRQRADDSVRIRFPVKSDTEDTEVQSAELRLLVPASNLQDSMNVKVFQVLNPRRKRLLDKRVIYLSENGPKWADFDITAAAQRWLVGERNLGLVLECLDCAKPLRPLESAMTALVLPEASKRRKRQANRATTDCRNDGPKPNCCRNFMNVTFQVLNYTWVVQPKFMDAGYCKGTCPLLYNLATSHAHIQGLIHGVNKSAAPKPCCAPAEFEPIDIVRLDALDPTKLAIQTWRDLKILKCKCS